MAQLALNLKSKSIQAAIAMLAWCILLVDWAYVQMFPETVHLIVGVGEIGLGCYLIYVGSKHWDIKQIIFWCCFSIAAPMLWHGSIAVTDYFGLEMLRAFAARVGLVVVFFTGLGWVIWYTEIRSKWYDHARRSDPDAAELAPSWNPMDPLAPYYGRKSPKLNQSLTGFTGYSIIFLLLCILLSSIDGCTRFYDLPAGGGEQQTVAQVVKVQKIIRKRYVVNPFSAISFDMPEIDDTQLELEEITRHNYKIGMGEGEGAGFASGTSDGKVGFIRLEYSGGDWNQDMGVGGDLNMLIKYFELTQQHVKEKTESVTVSQLGTYDAIRCPPVVYMTGQRSISMSNNEIKILQEYINDKHGMIFGDNGGSRHFHNQFVSMMARVMPDVRPVPIPLDDIIHRVPFQIPYLPYVAPHGGKEALGWFKDGRWICYYHPGDIGDAWADGHAGVTAEIWNACYQLGANVINYAHAEHHKWREAQKRKEDEE